MVEFANFNLLPRNRTSFVFSGNIMKSPTCFFQPIYPSFLFAKTSFFNSISVRSWTTNNGFVLYEPIHYPATKASIMELVQTFSLFPKWFTVYVSCQSTLSSLAWTFRPPDAPHDKTKVSYFFGRCSFGDKHVSTENSLRKFVYVLRATPKVLLV